MSKKFKCPKCGGLSSQCIRLDDGTYLHECGGCHEFKWSESTYTNTKYMDEVPARPTEDELMRVAPGWEVDRYDYPKKGEYYLYFLLGDHYLCNANSRHWRRTKERWILRKRPDWAYYQRENAEKWLADEYPIDRIVELKKTKGGELCILQNTNDNPFWRVAEADGPAVGEWRWVVEPKPAEYEDIAIEIDSTPWTWSMHGKHGTNRINTENFAGFVYADGSVEIHFKRVSNGAVEYATHVRVKK